MSDPIDTRDGWRELDVVTPDSIYQLAEYDPADGSVVRAWVREAPVPPLPTELYTVILLHGDQSTEGRVWVLCPGDPEDLWFESGWKIGSTAAELHSALDVTSFEVLAEPRAVTAKAVLDRIASEPWAREVDLTKWRREFGVSS